MTSSGNPQDPVADPAQTYPTVPPPRQGDDHHRGGRPGEHGEGKAAALLAGAAALANKVREEAPRKVQDVREKRAAGRFVIFTQLTGRPVAVGPYANEEAARREAEGMGAGAEPVELVSPHAYSTAGSATVSAAVPRR